MRIPITLLSVAILSFFYFWPANPPVVVLLIDGFPPKYLDDYNPPNLSRIANSGVRSTARSIFPAKSIASQYSMITGLYTKNHGILSNKMRLGDRIFEIGNTSEYQNKDWWLGEPIWQTAQKHNKKTFAYFWPGSETQEQRPDKWYPFNRHTTEGARIREVKKWLKRPPLFRPDLILVSLSDVDLSGHYFGTKSKQLQLAIEATDTLIGELLDVVENSDANLIILSDHGQVDLAPDKKIFLEDYIDVSTVDIIQISPYLMLNTDSGLTKNVYESLKDIHPAMSVYANPDFPSHWNWGYPERTPDIVATLNTSWSIQESRAIPSPFVAGHGFDDSNESLEGIFLATGPAFKEGATVEGFENIHLYELLAHLLEITPAPNDGDLEQVRALLKEQPDLPPDFPQ